MAAPGTFLIAKILWPETETPVTMGTVKMQVEKTSANFIETTVWRFGDLLVTSGLYGLHAIGVGIAGIGLICAGLAAVATDVARRAATSPDLEPESDERRA